jgi:dienelactone hydrolase
MRIHGWLTLPPDAKASPPLVVLLDEYFASSRTTSEFNTFRQLLATRGYAVAEIDARGTYGFGRAYVKAGDYQIAEGIPHDLEDGVRFLIAEGRVDARHIGVMGSGYGGLTAIELLAQAPELFTCWVNWNTPLLGDYTLRFQDLAARNRTWKEAVQDLGGRKAALQFSASANPSSVAAKIKAPSLHYYDNQPQRRQAMRDLLKKHHLPHVFVEELPSAKQRENHGEFLDACERTFTFLREHLAPSTVAARPAAPASLMRFGNGAP